MAKKYERVIYEQMPIAVSGKRRMRLIPPYSRNASRHIKAYQHIPFKSIYDKYFISEGKIIVDHYIGDTEE